MYGARRVKTRTAKIRTAKIRTAEIKIAKTSGWILAALFFAVSAVAAAQPAGIEAARRAYEASDYPKAVSVLQGEASANPNNGEVHLLLAMSYYEMQRHDEAINSAERAVAVDPKNSRYHEWLGRAYGAKAEHASWFSALSLAKKTRKEFEMAVQLDGNNFAARQALIEYDCSAPGIAGGGEDKAQREINEIAALDAVEGHYALGNCRRQKKDFATADTEFQKALDGRPKSVELIYDIGDYALRRSQADRLIAVANLGENTKPEDPRGKFYRAAGLILKGERLPEAEHLLAEYLQTAPLRTAYPRPAIVHVWLGRLFEDQSKHEAAVREYQTALKIDPKNKQAQDGWKRISKD